jgi:hypothetical protein
MDAALTKTRLPEVDFVEQDEPLIQSLMRFGNLALDIQIRSSRGAEINRFPFRLQDDAVRPRHAHCTIAQIQPALSNARLIHAIKVASTSATALSLTL